ncbi:hypothetical protein NI389_11795 [Pseudoalteromonas xiamenensis]|uniref:hypothetical protein n=1 Tax=Pseudoalteromonas xiamenensis TaxID=882626 RepID=UPI0027E5317A|nr:hypothetical protein [Pseudoalteromonas xiamenensis]WMN58901.1 hypothetical protein NI389_11795 [Pseudoalteromonas xiamenensis]
MKLTSSLFITGLFCSTLMLSLPSSAAMTLESEQVSAQQQPNVKTFTLELWAPDEYAPFDSKVAEFGDLYRYRYTPEQQAFLATEQNRKLNFELSPALKKRYQLKWIAASTPQYTRIEKMSENAILVGLDDGEQSGETYFELWVYDSVLKQTFMCDPRIVIEDADIP